MRFQRYLCAALCVTLTTSIAHAQDWTPERFQKQIGQLLVTRCLQCHAGPEAKGKLDLTTRAKARRGGSSGAAIVPGKPAQSLLWKRIAAGEMPPKKRLSKKEQALIRSWLRAGAVWSKEPLKRIDRSTRNRAGRDWWSLQPLRRPQIPPGNYHNPIDAFVQHRLRLKGLTASPRATPRVIVRRLTFDIIGLPPTPKEVSTFISQYQRDRIRAGKDLVDRLLKSRHYGERWGRHWLDVVRFGESQGFERDKLRDNSWPYRDWVIDALNKDLPYNEFARRQIAGDVLYPQDPQAITATGFLVAGPWDEVGQAMRSKAMKAVVRQDEIEDYVGTIGQAFLGLTINCARCHDHKFDPVSQREYYQLASAVSGVRHGSRFVYSRAAREKRLQLTQKTRAAQDNVAVLDNEVKLRLLRKRKDKKLQQLPPRVSPIARWDFERNLNDQVGKAHAVQHPKARLAKGRLLCDGGSGYAATHSVNVDLRAKTLEAWVRLDNVTQRGGAAITVHSTDGVQFDSIVFGEAQSGHWMAGSDFFKRTRSFQGPPETTTDKFLHIAVTYHSDGRVFGYRNGKRHGKPYRVATKKPLHFPAKKWYVLFGLRCGGPDANRQLRGQIECAQIYDRALSDKQILASYLWERAAISPADIRAALTEAEKKHRASLMNTIKKLSRERNEIKPADLYVVKPKQATVTHVLLRGNPARRGQPVRPGGVAALQGLKADFGLPANASDAARRIRLANWVTHRQNPLFARVIANRVWHYHFGAGLVRTTNDVGFNGGRPSHPALLDFLATELIRGGWRLKHLHRLIVSSETYLQSSRWRKDCAAVDAGNRLLWRKSPYRLEAEALRDSILVVAGQLNRQYGGPSYRDFKTFSNNSQFYEPLDIDDPKVYRRTVYRTWIRSGRNPFLDVFDCPDPSTTAPLRSVTTTPLQALALMNNAFVLRMADRFAARVKKESKPTEMAQTQRVFQIALGREPIDKGELNRANEFVKRHGLAAFCRVIFNSNEFIYVD